MNIGFIGMGNMARAIAGGLITAGVVRADALYAYAPHYERLEAFCAPLGIHACRSAEDVTDACPMIIMAVKPYIVEGVLSALGDRLANKAILSVVAGYTAERYRPLLPETARVQYIMPNTPCRVGEGMLLFEQENTLTPEELETALMLFKAVGRTEILPSRLMAAGMTVSGCGPAFFAMMIEALADAGVKYGLPRDVAYRLASQTALGTGKLQLETGEHPGALKDAVCSPGGTTIRGVEALEACGFRHACMEAVRAILD